MKNAYVDEHRRGQKRLAGVLLFCAAAALGLPAPAQDGVPVRGGTLVAALNSTTIPTLNTQLTSNVPALFAADVWADGLMTYGRKGNRLPRLATKWDIAPDGKTYTFTLRDGIKWSDGQPFTAEDVVFTLNSFGKYNTYLTKLMPLIEDASAPSPSTFVLKLKQPLTATLDLFDKEVFPLMPKHVYAGQDVATHPANLAPVGLGPFKFKSWKTGQAITFVRNEHYWEAGKPYLDSVVFSLIQNPQQRLNAMSNGEIDWFRPEVSQVRSAQETAKKGKFKVIQIENNAPETAAVDFNLTRKMLSDVRVRQALFHGIDRKRIVRDVYQGLAETSKNAIPSQFKDLHDPSVNYDTMYPYDPVIAAKLLDQAGYPLKDGKRFKLELTVPNAPPYDAVAKVVQAQWSALGIDVKLSALDVQIWINKVYTERNFDASVISLTGRTNPVLGVDRSFTCQTGKVPFANPTGYCNPEFDKVALEASAAPFGAQREHYKKYEEIVARDLNQIQLTNAQVYEAVSTRFKGLDAQFNFSFNTHPNWADAWLPK